MKAIEKGTVRPVVSPTDCKGAISEFNIIHIGDSNEVRIRLDDSNCEISFTEENFLEGISLQASHGKIFSVTYSDNSLGYFSAYSIH
jgi:hypothetical protein